ncbi:hypothetical protein SteCoe_32820 [Stentor coeruleus]|uniref:Uncharacterized protein n=1 Tax=Stentor coeruleus TaxID=5963 RepID=A0A1R2AY64_9CILI|nr:hypothetical protein SteCoe_32820 [Stentor coeruleus]
MSIFQLFFTTSLLATTQACNEYCWTACSVLNGKDSCFKACECDIPHTFPLIPDSFCQTFPQDFSLILNAFSCQQTDYHNCNLLETYSEIHQCAHNTNCITFFNFRSIIENTPSLHWPCIQPKYLLSYIQDPDFLKIFNIFDLSQKSCFNILHNLNKNISHKDFVYCLANSSSQLFNDMNEQCDIKCGNFCSNREKCLKNCKKDLCITVNNTRIMIEHDFNKELIMKKPKIFTCPVDDPEFKGILSKPLEI